MLKGLSCIAERTREVITENPLATQCTDNKIAVKAFHYCTNMGSNLQQGTTKLCLAGLLKNVYFQTHRSFYIIFS